MSHIDEFESAFRSAAREQFHHKPIDVERILVVCDGDTAQCERFQKRARQVLQSFTRNGKPEWISIRGDEYRQVSELLKLVESHRPSLICTYRNLHTPASEHPYSLGTFVDVLTQIASAPVILFPREIVESPDDGNWDDANSILAVTDHLSGDDHLVSYAAQLVEPGGKLYLAHIEDEQIFERYIETISKIPSIDTDLAREEILKQLLKDPLDYISTCQQVLTDEALPAEIEPIVAVGHALSDYKQVIADRDVDVVVMNTKDDEQLAMHGLAYPLTIELRSTPLLLL